jgi:hypothetical protein
MSANLSPLDSAQKAFCLGYEHAWLDVADGKYAYTAKLQERALKRALPLLDPSLKGGMEQKEILEPASPDASRRILEGCSALFFMQVQQLAGIRDTLQFANAPEGPGTTLGTIAHMKKEIQEQDAEVRQALKALAAQPADASEAEQAVKESLTVAPEAEPNPLAPRVRELEAALRYSARMLDPAEHDVAYILRTLQGGPEVDQSPSSPVGRECWVRWKTQVPYPSIFEAIPEKPHHMTGIGWEWVRMVEAPQDAPSREGGVA